MKGLDGLRGIAILAVIAFHEGGYVMDIGHPGVESVFFWNILNFGWLAVDLFFVLSGFLITGILLDALKNLPETGRRGYFAVFYSRRTLRIFPIYFVYLATVYRHYHIGLQPGQEGIWWYVFYVDNYKPDFGAFDGGLGHLWSLAVEEQFYLIWPLAVLLAGHKRLWSVSLWIAGAALAIRMGLDFGIHFPAEGIHRLTICRIDTFAIGAMTAILVRNRRDALIRRRKELWIVTALLCVVGILSMATPIRYTLSWTILSVGFALAVIGAAVSPPWILAWKPLRRIGTVSYCMYLFHQLIYAELWQHTAQRLHLRRGEPDILWHAAFFAVGGLMTYGFAELTFLCIEGPFNRMKRFFPYGRKQTPQSDLTKVDAVSVST